MAGKASWQVRRFKPIDFVATVGMQLIGRVTIHAGFFGLGIVDISRIVCLCACVFGKHPPTMASGTNGFHGWLFEMVVG